MGWFFVAAFGAGIFAAWGLTAGWQINWGGFLIFYPFFLLVLVVLALARPRGRKDGWQLATRACWPLALAALAEVSLSLEKTFGFLGFTLSLMAQIAVWVVTVGLAFAALYEAYRLWRGLATERLSLSEAIFALMDWFYLREPMEVGLGAGEKVEMVVNPSRWTTVYEVLWKRFWLWVGIGLGIGFGVAAMIFVLEAGQILLDGQLVEAVIPFHWWLIVAVALGLESLALAYTWFIEEWNRRQLRFVFMTGTAWVVRTRAPEGTVYLSFGPAASLEEIKLHSPGEKAGQESSSFWGRIWDGILWNRFHVGDFFLPSRVFGAADTLDGVEWPMGTFNALRAIASAAKILGGSKEVAGRAIMEAQMDDAQAPGWVSVGEQKVARVLAAINALLPPGLKVDLRRVGDPGLWDRRTGVKVVPVAISSAATTLAAFPQAQAVE